MTHQRKLLRFLSLFLTTLSILPVSSAVDWQSIGKSRCVGVAITEQRFVSLADCQQLCVATATCKAISSERGSSRRCALFPDCNRRVGGTIFLSFESFVMVTKSPTTAPSASPSLQPSASPSISPSLHPSTSPSASPTTQPTLSPSSQPSTSPSLRPTKSPQTLGPTSSPQVLVFTARGDVPTRSGGLVVVGLLSFCLGVFLLCLVVLLLARTPIWDSLRENGLTTWIARQAGTMEFVSTAPLVLAYFDLTSDIVFGAALTNNGQDYYRGVALICCLVALVLVNGSIASCIIYGSTSPEFDAWRKSYPRHLILLRFSSFFSLDSFTVFRSSALFNSGHLDIPFLNASTSVYVCLGFLNHLLEDIPVLIIAAMLHGGNDQTTKVAQGLSVFTSSLVLCSRLVQLFVHFVRKRAASKSSDVPGQPPVRQDKRNKSQTNGPASYTTSSLDYNASYSTEHGPIVDPSAEYKVEQNQVQFA